MVPSPLRGIVLDLDDTLITFDEMVVRTLVDVAATVPGADAPALAQAVAEAIARRWLDNPASDYCARIGISRYEGMIGNFGGPNADLEALKAWVPEYRAAAWNDGLAAVGMEGDGAALAETYRQLCISRFLPEPGVVAFLEAAKKKGYKLAMLTNGAPDLQRLKVAASGLGPHFEVIIVSGEQDIGKPDARILEITLERLGVAKAEAIMVGNSAERDIGVATNAGVFGIWMNRDGEDCGMKPDAEIATIYDLAKLVDVSI